MIAIYVMTRNRKEITNHCLASLRCKCPLFILDNLSTAYDVQWLRKFSQYVSMYIKQGESVAERIKNMRNLQVLQFVNSDFKYAYFTENDALHDPYFMQQALYLYALTEQNYPICLYNSPHHQHKKQIDFIDHYIRHRAPGISLFLDKLMAEKILNSDFPETCGWDKHVSELFDRFCVSKMSYVEHLGKDGIHSNDFEHDRALNPTPFLVKRRREILREIGEGC